MLLLFVVVEMFVEMFEGRYQRLPLAHIAAGAAARDTLLTACFRGGSTCWPVQAPLPLLPFAAAAVRRFISLLANAKWRPCCPAGGGFSGPQIRDKHFHNTKQKHKTKTSKNMLQEIAH